MLDPPRSGAGAQVVREITGRRPRAIAYVACDPAALARDLATAAQHGYAATSIRGFDLFPMTQHVECVAVLEPDAENGDSSGRLVAVGSAPVVRRVTWSGNPYRRPPERRWGTLVVGPGASRPGVIS